MVARSGIQPGGAAGDAGAMRRRDRALDREAAEALLGRALVGRLGTVAGGRPYVVPLSFVYVEGRIYFHSHPRGLKMDAIRAHPTVCFEVDELVEVVPAARGCDMGLRYESAIAFGRARVVESPERKLAALQALVGKYWGRATDAPAAALPAAADLAGVEVVEIEVEWLTGKRGA